jgi:glucose-6-phosphate isomerase
VEDNADPDRMQALLDVLDMKRTCFNVITKSGSTSETMSQFLIVRDGLRKVVGDRWRSHMIATTDKRKGTLIRIAREESIKTFFIPDGVGGRFSVLSRWACFQPRSAASISRKCLRERRGWTSCARQRISEEIRDGCLRFSWSSP